MLSLLIALFLDFLAFSVLITLLPFIFGDSPISLIPEGLSSNIRYLLFGSFLGAYSIFQWLGNTFFSKWMRTHNARRFVRFSYLGNCLCYLLCAFGIEMHLLSFLFLGNAVAGFLGTNVSGTHAAISALKERDSRYRMFNSSSLCIGAALLIGPLPFSRLITSIESGAISITGIFIGCALISLISSLIVGGKHLPIKENTAPLKRLPMGANRRFFFSLTLFALGWAGFIKFFQLRVIEMHTFSNHYVCLIPSFFGMGVFLSQLMLLVLPVVQKVERIFIVTLSSMGVLALLTSIIYSGKVLAILLILLSFLYAILQATTPMFAIEKGVVDNEGEMMAITHSALALGKSLAPLIGGAVIYLTTMSPCTFAGFLLIGSAATLHTARSEPKLATD